MTNPYEAHAKLMLELEKQAKLYEATEACDAMPVKVEGDKKPKTEKKAEDVNPSAADTPSKQIDPKLETGETKKDAPDAPKGGKGTEGELKPKDAKEQANITVKVEEAGNKPLTKDASEVDNARKELKPKEADQPADVKVVSEVSGNKPVQTATPGEQKKVEEPAEKKAAEGDDADVYPKGHPKAGQPVNPVPPDLFKPAPTNVPVAKPVVVKKSSAFVRAVKKAALLQKIAKVLSADDKPVNAPKEITAEGSEAATLSGDDSRKAMQTASDAVGKATSEFTMHRGQQKGVDPSALHMERGSRRDEGRDQDNKKIASVMEAAAPAAVQKFTAADAAAKSNLLKNIVMMVGLPTLAGSGLGALLAKKGKRLQGAGLGALIGAGTGVGTHVGSIGGGALGNMLGRAAAPNATANDVINATLGRPTIQDVYGGLGRGIGGLGGLVVGGLAGGHVGSDFGRNVLGLRTGRGKEEKEEKQSAYFKLGKSVSKSQQKFMGMVHAVQKGDMPAPSKEVAEIAGEMKPRAVTEYAETKRKGLPDKKTEKKAGVDSMPGKTYDEKLDNFTLAELARRKGGLKIYRKDNVNKDEYAKVRAELDERHNEKKAGAPFDSSRLETMLANREYGLDPVTAATVRQEADQGRAIAATNNSLTRFLSSQHPTEWAANARAVRRMADAFDSDLAASEQRWNSRPAVQAVNTIGNIVGPNIKARLKSISPEAYKYVQQNPAKSLGMAAAGLGTLGLGAYGAGKLLSKPEKKEETVSEV